MINLRPFFILSALLFTSSYLLAQDIDSLPSKKSSLRIGQGYASNSVYLGRTDSITIPGYNTSLAYTLKSGIFFAGSVNFVPSREVNKMDGGSLEAGYNFEHKNLSGGVSLAKYFNSFNSTQLMASLSASLGAELMYNIHNMITPSVYAGLAVGNTGGGNDFTLNTRITHNFLIDKPFSSNDNLSISPAIHLNAGSQNFYSTYYIHKNQRAANIKANIKGKGNSSMVKSSTAAQTINSNKFQVLDYEYTLPVSYTIKKYSLELTPSYDVAVHEIDGNTTQTAYMANSSVFYMQAGFSYSF